MTPHPADHQGCDPDVCLAAKLRYWRAEGGLQVAPSATPSRFKAGRPERANPVWERGTVSEARPGGTRMPYLDEKLNPIRVKQFGERRHEYESRIKRLKTDPNVFAKASDAS